MADRGSSAQFLSSGEVARLTGLSTDTLRHYERKGLIPPPRRKQNGYRQYPADTLDRVRLVRRALALGFTLDELSHILKVRDQGGSPCRQVRRLAAQKLADLEARLAELATLRDELKAILPAWDERLAQQAETGQARLLEALAVEGASSTQIGLSARGFRQKRKQ